jgi:5-methylcytosine-specific restriction protein A
MIKRIYTKIKDKIQGKHSKRSGNWQTVRKKHLLLNPTCAVCGGNKKLEVHHIKPFKDNPELELDPENLITLCESKSYGIVCHRTVGHLGSYFSYNENVVEDAAIWKEKFENRP